MKHLPSNGFRWSFSKLASFRSCPMSFYLEYVCNPSRDEEIPNFFAQYGSCAHKILEEYFKGRLPQFLLASEWSRRYPEEVTCPPPAFPKGYDEKAYAAGLKYFETFDGFGPDWDVVSVEQKFTILLEGYTLVGVADLVLRNKETGAYWVIDHKSKSKSSMRKDRDLYRNQLYLYAIWVHEAFGVYPEKLSFSLFKEGGLMVDEVFSEDQLAATKQWFVDSIRAIEICDLFETWKTCIPLGESKESYYCRNICGCNVACDDYQEVRRRSYDAWLAKKQAEEGFLYDS